MTSKKQKSAGGTKSVKAAKLATDDQLDRHTPETLITYRVFRAAQAMSRLVDVSVRTSIGLTSRQWRVLVVLNRLGTAASGDVARVAGYDHSQVSRITVELTKLGLIEQWSDSNDRRKLLLRLTDAGRDYLKRGLPGSMEREKRLRARLTEAQYDALCEALTLVTEEANILYEEASRKGVKKE